MAQWSPRYLLGGAAAAVLFVLPANAHHGWAGNERDVTEMTGVVRESVSMAGPHATMKIAVDEKVWDITLAPPSRTANSGLDNGVIPVGETVTVRGNKNMNADRLEMKTIQVRWGDKTYHVYPDRGG